MSNVDMILHNKKEDRFILRSEERQWPYGIICGPPDVSGRGKVYQILVGEKGLRVIWIPALRSRERINKIRICRR